MYFRKFPSFEYQFNNKSYTFLDIFRRVKFDNATLNNKQIFFEYYLTDGETLEKISSRYYNTADYWWLLILSNNILSNLEIPTDENYIQSYIDTKYSGKALYFSDYMPDLLPGDVLATVTLSGNNIDSTSSINYAVIEEYNKIFRYVRVKEINGTINQNDNIGFYRDTITSEVTHDVITSSGGSVQKLAWATVKKIGEYKDAPIEFNSANSNYISPYFINSTNETRSNVIGNYTTASIDDTDTVNNTLLYKFMTSVNDTNLDSIITNENKVRTDNEKFRTIKVLNPIYVKKVVADIFSLLNSDTKIITIQI